MTEKQPIKQRVATGHTRLILLNVSLCRH